MRCFATRKSQQSLSQGAKGRSKPASYSNFQEPKHFENRNNFDLWFWSVPHLATAKWETMRNLWFDVALPTLPTVPHSFIIFHHPSPSLVGVTKGPKTKVKLDQIVMIPSISKLSFPWKKGWKVACFVQCPATMCLNYVACSVWDRIPSETGLSRFATVFGFTFPSICRWSYLQELLRCHPAIPSTHAGSFSLSTDWWSSTSAKLVKIGWICCVRELGSAIMGNPLENHH